MAKNHRLKKKLKSERSKVQFKVKSEKTKFLPKGQNVTDVNFKIKPIVLPQQFQEDEQDANCKRKLNIDEITKRLKHYNDKMKYNACVELVELLKIDHETVLESLGPILHRVSAIIYEAKESKNREVAIKIIDIILEKTPVEKLEGFFHYLTISLRIAMLSLNTYIKEDSLLLLDSILKRTPQLLARDGLKVITDFFSLISKLKSDSSLDRTLTMNLGSKLTSVKWRLKVLSRLHEILTAVYHQRLSDKDLQHKELPLYKRRPFDKLLFNDGTDDWDDRSKYFTKYFKTLVPLLLDTWIEVAPENPKHSTEKTLLNEEAIAVLGCVLDVFVIWSKYTDLEKEENAKFSFNHASGNDLIVLLGSEEGNKFIRCLMKGFPYSESMKRKKGKASEDILKILGHRNYNCIQENLMISYLSLIANLKTKVSVKREVKAVTLYLTKLLERDHVSSIHNKDILSCLDLILHKYPSEAKRKGVDLKSILECAIKHSTGKITPDHKYQIFKNLILDNYASKRLYTSECNSLFDEWVSTLPNELLQRNVSHKMIRLLILIASRSPKFQEVLLEKFVEILLYWSDQREHGNQCERHTKFELLGFLFKQTEHCTSHHQVLRDRLSDLKDDEPKLQSIFEMIELCKLEQSLLDRLTIDVTTKTPVPVLVSASG